MCDARQTTISDLLAHSAWACVRTCCEPTETPQLTGSLGLPYPPDAARSSEPSREAESSPKASAQDDSMRRLCVFCGAHCHINLYNVITKAPVSRTCVEERMFCFELTGDDADSYRAMTKQHIEHARGAKTYPRDDDTQAPHISRQGGHTSPSLQVLMFAASGSIVYRRCNSWHRCISLTQLTVCRQETSLNLATRPTKPTKPTKSSRTYDPPPSSLVDTPTKRQHTPRLLSGPRSSPTLATVTASTKKSASNPFTSQARYTK